MPSLRGPNRLAPAIVPPQHGARRPSSRGGCRARGRHRVAGRAPPRRRARRRRAARAATCACRRSPPSTCPDDGCSRCGRAASTCSPGSRADSRCTRTCAWTACGTSTARALRWAGGPDHQVRVVLETDDWDGDRLPAAGGRARRDRARGRRRRAPRSGPARPRLRPRRGAAPTARRPDARDRAGAARPAAARRDRQHLQDRDAVRPAYLAVDAGGRGRRPRARWSTPRAGCSTRNKAHASQATTGDPRRGHEHWVYGRAGRPCRRCGTTIVSAMQGAAPYDRITAFCPRLPARPAPATPAAPRSARR